MKVKTNLPSDTWSTVRAPLREWGFLRHLEDIKRPTTIHTYTYALLVYSQINQITHINSHCNSLWELKQLCDEKNRTGPERC